MPNTTEAPTLDEIRERISTAVQKLTDLGEGTSPEDREGLTEAVADMRDNFPGLGNENLVRIADYVFSIAHGLFGVTGDQVVWAMAAGFASVANELLKDVA